MGGRSVFALVLFLLLAAGVLMWLAEQLERKGQEIREAVAQALTEQGERDLAVLAMAAPNGWALRYGVPVLHHVAAALVLYAVWVIIP